MRSNAKSYPKFLPEPTAKTLRQMWPKIKVPDGCWEWTGSCMESGYPNRISVVGADTKGSHSRPQRLMFSWFKYEIPEGFTVDHLCKNRKCVNPDHMEAVSHEENTSRGNKRSYCKRGHAQTPENRYVYKCHGKKKERCRLCIPIQTAAWKAGKSLE